MTTSPTSLTSLSSSEPRLVRGDLLPRMATRDQAPLAEFAAKLERFEAPGINTLIDGRTDLVLAEALGANLLDAAGNRYIDLVCGFGVGLLGHRHPAVVAAIKQQADRLLHGLGDVYAHPGRIQLAETLAALAPQPDAKVYFAVSGADAVEIALKTAVLASGRGKVLAFDPGYHGLTLGALHVTSREAFKSPFRRHDAGHVERLPFGADPDRIAKVLETREFAAVIFEPVVGREGILFPPEGWAESLLEIATHTGTISIADEIFTGMRRTGPWFAHAPGGSGSSGTANAADLVCCGKALGGGLPIGAVIGRGQLLDAWTVDGEALHTGTFVGHPLACAAALAALEQLGMPWVDERLAAIENAFTGLQATALGGASVRGQGALWAIEAASEEQATVARQYALERGVLLLVSGPERRVLQAVPPLVITDEQLGFAIATLREGLVSAAP